MMDNVPQRRIWMLEIITPLANIAFDSYLIIKSLMCSSSSRSNNPWILQLHILVTEYPITDWRSHLLVDICYNITKFAFHPTFNLGTVIYMYRFIPSAGLIKLVIMLKVPIPHVWAYISNIRPRYSEVVYDGIMNNF